jgi:L-ascorbate metabolism protein UlaG (beta-lactamase superfamily)
MKIQWFGQNHFAMQTSKATLHFDPSEGQVGEGDVALISSESLQKPKESKKTLDLPGEFEIAEALITGHYCEDKNIVFKITLDNLSIVNFGHLTEKPNGKFFEKLGENIDVILINLSEKFPAKVAKDLVETIDPRLVIFGGDTAQFPEITKLTGAKTSEENPMDLSKSSLSDDKTDWVILPI